MQNAINNFRKEQYAISGETVSYPYFLLFSMHSLSLFLSVDSNLGRVDYNSLSDQMLMEMLYGGFDEVTQQLYQNEDDIYFDVCEWSSVQCDPEGKVIEINEYSIETGSLQISCIPPAVTSIEISQTKLTGSIDLEQLPQYLGYLSLEYNQLTGSIDLTQLPDAMEMMYLSSNQFTGSVDLTKLPEKMSRLYLDNNQLTGSIDLAHLPYRMQTIYLEENQFSGSFIATNLPLELREIRAALNCFDATAVVDSQPNADIILSESGVTSVVDVNGNTNIRVSLWL